MAFVSPLVLPRRGASASAFARAAPLSHTRTAPQSTPAFSHRRLPSPGQTLPRASVTPSAAALYSPIALDMEDDTRVSFQFTLAAATDLGHQINDVVNAFQTISKAAAEGNRVIEKSLEYVYSGEAMRVEIECNPNIFPNAFNAKVYVKVDDGRVKVTSQTMLTKLIDNVKAYKATMSA